MEVTGAGVAAAAFAAGCLLQMVYLAWGRWTRRHVLGVAVVGPLGWVLTSVDSDPVAAAFSVALAVTVALALAFRASIIPVTGEHTLLLAALPLWALILEGGDGPWFRLLVGVHALASLLILLLVASRRPLPRGLRILATAYAVFQISVLFGWQFRWRTLGFFHGDAPPPPLEALTSGLLFAFVVAHLAQLYAIVRPLETGTKEREARRQHLDLLAQRFQDTHLGLLRGGAMTVLFVAYWGLGRGVLRLEAMVLLWPWLVLTPRLLDRVRSAPATTAV